MVFCCGSRKAQEIDAVRDEVQRMNQQRYEKKILKKLAEEREEAAALETEDDSATVSSIGAADNRMSVKVLKSRVHTLFSERLSWSPFASPVEPNDNKQQQQQQQQTPVNSLLLEEELAAAKNNKMKINDINSKKQKKNNDDNDNNNDNGEDNEESTPKPRPRIRKKKIERDVSELHLDDAHDDPTLTHDAASEISNHNNNNSMIEITQPSRFSSIFCCASARSKLMQEAISLANRMEEDSDSDDGVAPPGICACGAEEYLCAGCDYIRCPRCEMRCYVIKKLGAIACHKCYMQYQKKQGPEGFNSLQAARPSSTTSKVSATIRNIF